MYDQLLILAWTDIWLHFRWDDECLKSSSSFVPALGISEVICHLSIFALNECFLILKFRIWIKVHIKINESKNLFSSKDPFYYKISTIFPNYRGIWWEFFLQYLIGQFVSRTRAKILMIIFLIKIILKTILPTVNYQFLISFKMLKFSLPSQRIINIIIQTSDKLLQKANIKVDNLSRN